MSKSGGQVIYKQLLERHRRVRIPMIQRDYAQGRPAQKEVREEFLGVIASALTLPAGDPSLPLNLDFIYGSVEGQNVLPVGWTATAHYAVPSALVSGLERRPVG